MKITDLQKSITGWIGSIPKVRQLQVQTNLLREQISSWRFSGMLVASFLSAGAVYWLLLFLSPQDVTQIAADARPVMTLPLGLQGQCLEEGWTSGPWKNVFNGYGCNQFVSREGKNSLNLRPQRSNGEKETHASLFTGPAYANKVKIKCNVTTLNQLRQGYPPKAWEAGWVAWHLKDPDHFYYFVCQPNGWELGKRTPEGVGGQQFLRTGSKPAFPVGHTYAVQIVQDGNLTRVSVDGKVVVEAKDDQDPFSSGAVGFYTEDADVAFDSVAITGDSVDTLSGSAAAVASASAG